MDLLFLAKFSLIASLVVATAWEPRPQRVTHLLASCGLKHLSFFFAAVWIATILAFWLFFWGIPEFWQIFALLMETAGVTYLAREVYIAQGWEEYERVTSKGRPFVDLEQLANQRKYEEYVTEYYRLDGRSPREAEVDIALYKNLGTLASKVDELKSHTRKIFERPKGPLAITTFEYRRNRLRRGIILVILGLVGHGLHTLTPHEQSEIAEPRHAIAETQSKVNSSILQLQKVQAELSQQIAKLEQNGASREKEIATIVAENKRWHVVKVRSPQRSPQGSSDRCCCTPTSLSCQSN